jgi:phosphopantetheinyl transferase
MSAPAIDAFDRMLSADERIHRDRFASEEDRRAYSVAHGLARWALSQHASTSPDQWRFEINKYGKPSVVEEQAGAPRLEFNLSHTRTLVACVVSRGSPVGIDVEHIHATSWTPDVVSHYFAPSEVHMLDQLGDSDYTARFIEIWTLKEAYIKAIGEGLTLPLDSLALAFDGVGGVHLSHSSKPGSCHFALAAPSEDTRMGIAVAASGKFELVIHSPAASMPSGVVVLRRSDGLFVTEPR